MSAPITIPAPRDRAAEADAVRTWAILASEDCERRVRALIELLEAAKPAPGAERRIRDLLARACMGNASALAYAAEKIAELHRGGA